MLDPIARTDVLLVDDFAMAPLNDGERRVFLEIADDRYGRRPTVLTSQLPVASWHVQIGDPTIANSILDRLVHSSYRIEMNGESIRKNKPAATEKPGELTPGLAEPFLGRLLLTPRAHPGLAHLVFNAQQLFCLPSLKQASAKSG